MRLCLGMSLPFGGRLDPDFWRQHLNENTLMLVYGRIWLNTIPLERIMLNSYPPPEKTDCLLRNPRAVVKPLNTRLAMYSPPNNMTTPTLTGIPIEFAPRNRRAP
jgi:hypothetical protein